MKQAMHKLSEDGKVAVLYSPGFGAGWYTWNNEHPQLIFDPAIVRYVEQGEKEKLKEYMALKYPNVYLGGIDDLTVAWIPEGTAFRIGEYDGSENLEIMTEVNWMIA
jgi:hypothetical protein